jgi:hypothetical protein
MLVKTQYLGDTCIKNMLGKYTRAISEMDWQN